MGARAFEFDVEDVLEQLSSFPRGTSAGATALGVQHLLDATHQTHGDAAPKSVAGIVNLLARGDVATAVSRYLGGLRRLTARCLCSASRARASDLLAPTQVGVGVSGGAEAMVHCLRQ